MTRTGTPLPSDEVFGFDPVLEESALRCLAEFDTAGCRAKLGLLASRLTAEAVHDADRAIPLLLLDVLQRVNRRIHATGTDHERCQTERHALNRCFAECSAAEDARGLFLTELNRLLALLNVVGDRSSYTVVDRARRYIDANYDQRLFLSSIATKLNVSPNYLSRLFREQVGVTLTHYIQQRRVEQARLMLAAGNDRISAIAYHVGYQNYRDFYRNFVKLEGASPRVVQRRLTESRRQA